MPLNEMYVGKAGSPITALASQYTIGDSSLSLTDSSVLASTVPNLLTIYVDNNNFVTIRYTSIAGNVVSGLTVKSQGIQTIFPAGTIVSRNYTYEDDTAIKGNITILSAEKLDINQGTEHAGKVMKVGTDGKLAPSSSTASVSFADILGQPTDNTNLNTALSNKVTKHDGTFEMGSDALGIYVWED